MSSTLVFIDDAVQGRLPAVCAKTGVPARRVLRLESDLTGGLGPLWILLFFGPLGWLVLVVVALSRRRSTLTVRLPYSDAVLGEYARRGRRTFICAGVVAVVLGVTAAAPFLFPDIEAQAAFSVAAVAFGAGVIAVAVCAWQARRMLVTVDLDASGRWVTLKRVHPDFAAACDKAARSGSQRAAGLPSVPPNVPQLDR
jgi:hypothetical protein